MPSHVKIVKNRNKSQQKPFKKMTNKENVEESDEQNVEIVKTKEDAKAIVVEQEIKFARCLAGNDPKVRNRVLKNLKKWLKLRSMGSFGEFSFLYLKFFKVNFKIIFFQHLPTLISSGFGKVCGIVCGCLINH